MMEHASLSGNTKIFFQLIRATEGFRSRVSKRICEKDSPLITKLQRRLERGMNTLARSFAGHQFHLLSLERSVVLNGLSSDSLLLTSKSVRNSMEQWYITGKNAKA
ncbi:unnamed protein product [Dicrocoelium dendriticum]|nr:unnamed protein product [Dicrocoelium dendriticum]